MVKISIGVVKEVKKSIKGIHELWNSMLDYLNLDYDIFGLLHDIPASCCLFHLSLVIHDL